MNPFSAIIRKLSGLEEAEKKAELVKQRNERVLAPLRQKAASRNLNKLRSGSITPTAYQNQNRTIQRSAFDTRPTPKMGWWESNVVDRFSQNTELDKYKRTNDFVRSQDVLRKDLTKQVPGMVRPELRDAYINKELNNRATRFQELLNEGQAGWLRNKFDANTVQDRMARMSKGDTEVYAPDLAAGESRGLIGQFTHPLIGGVMSARNRLDTGLTELVGQAVEQLPGTNNIFDRYGKNIQQFADDKRRILDRDLQGSRFATSARAGELAPLVQVGSGTGSLATSLATTLATGNPWAAAATFGIGEAGEQAGAAREAGLEGWKSLAVGGTAGVAEAALEKVGLDKLFEASGGKTVASRALSGFISEAIQEGSQSMSSSTISNIYQDVDYGKAFKDALVEAGYGGIIGAGASVSMGAVQSIINDPKVKNITQQNIQKQIKDLGKTTKNIATGKSNLTPAQIKSINRDIKTKKDKIALDHLPRLAKAKADGKTATVATLEKEIGQLERDIEMLNARKNGQGGYLNLGSDDIDNIELPQSLPQNKQASQEPSLANTNPLESLKQEARKFATADEFIVSKIGRTSLFDPKRAELRAIYEQANPKTVKPKAERPERVVKSAPENTQTNTPEYAMSHRPNKLGATADDITTIKPELTDDPSAGTIPKDFYDKPEWYANLNDVSDRESLTALKKLRNKPDATVTIYRASPKNELNEGDWVTLSKSYAKQESMTEGTPVNSFKVKAKDIQFAGDSINEFGYYPQAKNEAGFINADPNDSEVIKAVKKLTGKDEATQSQPPKSPPTVGKKPTLQDALEGSKKPFVSFTEIAEGRAKPQTESRGTEYKGQQDQSGRLDNPQSALEAQEALELSQPQVAPQSPTTQTQQKVRQSEQLLANQTSNQKTSSQENPLNNMDSIPSDAQIDQQNNQEASQRGEFDAVAASPNSKSGRKLVDAIKDSTTLTKAAKEAQNSGKELNFVAVQGKKGLDVGIQPVDLNRNRIEAGFVVDEKGNVIGNHIKVDSTGIQVNVGGQMANIESIIGNPADWKNRWKVDSNINRNIKDNAPTTEIANKTISWLWTNKGKNERGYRTELDSEYSALDKRIKSFESAKPSNVNKKQWKKDLAAVLDGKKTDAEIRAEYDKSSADVILKQKKEIRQLLDTVFERINTERVKYGQAPIEYRKDYLTHVNELMQNKSFVGDVYSSIKNSFVDDGMQKTREGVPGNITGRTSDFKPISAYNKYLQRRKGDMTVDDPFAAVQAYLEPALYNIHMTESTARARAVESAFRTASEMQQMTGEQVVGEATQLLKPYKNDNNEMADGFQEWANTLARKSNKYDRPLLDKKGTRQVVRGSQFLQRVGGRGTILGNLSSVLAQPLNQVVGVSDAGVSNYLKGIAMSVGGDSKIEKSNFYQSRIARNNAPIKKTSDKVFDAGAVPLQTVEEASIKIILNSQIAKAESQGLKGQAAIDKADIETERLVAGRGIGDKPDAYRSVLANNLLQYTLEVNAQNKAFWNDLNVQQKGTFLVASMGMNTLMSAITGFTPLPDFLKAALDTFGDFIDDEDERSGLEKAVGGVQRGAGEYVGMNPIASAGANALLSQDQRRSLFGDESQVGMFEGTAAPVQVVRNTVDAGRNLARGNYTEARNDALRNVPFGNQARKTWTGAETLSRGYAVDGSGNPTFAAPTSLYGKAQTLAFGPSSTSNARDYYDNKQTNITGKEDLKVIESSSDKAQTVSQIQERRMTNKEAEQAKEAGKVVSSTAGNSREELITRLDAGDDTLTDTEKTIAKTLKDLPQGLSEEATNEILRYERLNTDTKKRLYKGVQGKLAIEKAWYEKDMLQGTLSESQQYDTEFKIAKLEIAQPYGDRVYDLYGMALYKINTIADDETYNKLVAYDRELFENDLIDKPKFKENRTATSRSGRRASSGGSKSGKFSIPSGFSLLPGGSSGSSSSVANLVRNAEVIYRKS